MMLSAEMNRLRYRLYAPIYTTVAKPLDRGRRRAIDRLDLTAQDRILLVGSGPGVDLPYLPDDAAVTAIDLTETMVERTARRGREQTMAVDALVGEAHQLPFEDDAFDAVLCHLILSVVPEPAHVVAEVSRVLTPNGRVSLYDKFVPEGTTPSLLRRAVNPFTRLLFSDVTRALDPMFTDTDLEVCDRESFFADIYTVATAQRPSGVASAIDQSGDQMEGGP